MEQRSNDHIERTAFHRYAPKTGKRQLDTQLPLYRFRSAIANILDDFVAQNSE